MNGDPPGPARAGEPRAGTGNDLAALLAKITDAVGQLEEIAGPRAAGAAQRARTALAATGQTAGRARATAETRAAELAATRHERDAALAELDRVRAAATAALAACKRARGGTSPGPIEEAIAALRAVTSAPPDPAASTRGPGKRCAAAGRDPASDGSITPPPRTRE